MKSSIVKRSVVLAGRRTSVSLEEEFWNGLKEIADGRHITPSDLVGAINAQRQHDNLFVLEHYLTKASGREAE